MFRKWTHTQYFANARKPISHHLPRWSHPILHTILKTFTPRNCILASNSWIILQMDACVPYPTQLSTYKSAMQSDQEERVRMYNRCKKLLKEYSREPPSQSSVHHLQLATTWSVITTLFANAVVLKSTTAGTCREALARILSCDT